VYVLEGIAVYVLEGIAVYVLEGIAASEGWGIPLLFLDCVGGSRRTKWLLIFLPSDPPGVEQRWRLGRPALFWVMLWNNQ
jgi:hypothetical protein